MVTIDLALLVLRPVVGLLFIGHGAQTACGSTRPGPSAPPTRIRFRAPVDAGGGDEGVAP